MFKDLPHTYQTWLASQCLHNAMRIKQADIELEGHQISTLTRDELEALAQDDTLTTWQMDIVRSYLSKRPFKQSSALTTLLGQ